MIVREINIAQDHAIGEPVTMMDYGLKLKLTGVELPPSYEVHFSNGLSQPSAVTIGDATGVVVPYEYTELSGTLYGWLYLHNSMQDGYTERSFAVKVTRRSPLDPPQVLPPQATVIEQAIVALNTAIERTEAARDAAEESATEAEQSAQQAAQSAAGAAGSESAAQGYAQQAEAAKTAAVTATGQAEASATAAASSATAASGSAATANAAATRAEYAMDAARASATSADESAALAQTAMEESADNAQNAAESATNAATSAASAETAATNASTSATNAANSASAAGQAQTAAESAASTATEKATEAGQSAADAAESAAEAEAAATEAGQIVDDVEAWALGAYATSSASGAVATVDDGAENVPVKALKAYIVPVQDGTGDPSPDNVRPIHGFTGMNLAATGKNIFNDAAADWKDNYFLASNGNEVADASYRYTQGYTKVNPGTIYTFSYGVSGTVTTAVTVCFYDSNKTFISRSSAIPAGSQMASGNFTTPQNAVYIRFSCKKGNELVQIEKGTTATEYEAFGTLYPVTWQDEAGTVYGGYFNTVTGVLTVTMAKYHATSVSSVIYSASAGVYYCVVVSNRILSLENNSGTVMSDRFVYGYLVPGVWYITAYGKSIVAVLPDQTITTKAQADAWFAENPTDFVYELATPIEYQLDPLDVRTLHGVNNIFTDTGNTDATVRADPDLHINKLITEAVALALENA